MIKMIHSGWAYVALILLVVAVISAIMNMNSDKEFSKKTALFGLIGSHIQMLFGLIAYFSSSGYTHLKQEGMGIVMKNAHYRDQIMEHPLLMIIGIVLITIGWMKHKNKTTAKAKYKTIAIFYGIGLVLILAKIPWTTWFNH